MIGLNRLFFKVGVQIWLIPKVRSSDEEIKSTESSSYGYSSYVSWEGKWPGSDQHIVLLRSVSVGCWRSLICHSQAHLTHSLKLAAGAGYVCVLGGGGVIEASRWQRPLLTGQWFQDITFTTDSVKSIFFLPPWKFILARNTTEGADQALLVLHCPLL
jgi:hypothetical protein